MVSVSPDAANIPVATAFMAVGSFLWMFDATKHKARGGGKGAATLKNKDAAMLYEPLPTIPNATELEFPADNPPTGGVQLSAGTSLYCGSQTRQILNLWSTNYGIGVQAGALYFRVRGDNVGNSFAWYRGGSHNDGFLNGGAGSLTLMSLNAAGLSVSGVVNATAFNPSSDRNLKENFTAVSPREVLDKVAALPISRWNFKGDTAAPHIGPMAQDFHAAFALGTDDKHIATVDADGVALAAIQGLNQKLNEKDAEIEALKQSVVELKNLVQTLVEKK
jgi:hypothetical protein